MSCFINKFELFEYASKSFWWIEFCSRPVVVVPVVDGSIEEDEGLAIEEEHDDDDGVFKYDNGFDVKNEFDRFDEEKLDVACRLELVVFDFLFLGSCFLFDFVDDKPVKFIFNWFDLDNFDELLVLLLFEVFAIKSSWFDDFVVEVVTYKLLSI